MKRTMLQRNGLSNAMGSGSGSGSGHESEGRTWVGIRSRDLDHRLGALESRLEDLLNTQPRTRDLQVEKRLRSLEDDRLRLRVITLPLGVLLSALFGVLAQILLTRLFS